MEPQDDCKNDDPWLREKVNNASEEQYKEYRMAVEKVQSSVYPAVQFVEEAFALVEKFNDMVAGGACTEEERQLLAVKIPHYMGKSAKEYVHAAIVGATQEYTQRLTEIFGN